MSFDSRQGRHRLPDQKARKGAAAGRIWHALTPLLPGETLAFIVALYRSIATTSDLPSVGAGRESGTFDFKGSADPTNKRELAKDVAAFANALGGVILIGAAEDKEKGTLLEYNPMPEVVAEALKAAYDSAVVELCRPQPVVDAVRIQAPQSLSGYVVAVNVNPTPIGPVGVRWNDDLKSPAWKFPLRATTHTAFLTPTELAMLMVPEIRRVAILLDSIPKDERTGIRLAFYYGSGSIAVEDFTLIDLDPLLTAVRFSLTRFGADADLGAIPLDRVTSVWKRDPTHWNIVIDGNIEIQNRGFIFFPR